MGSLKKGHREQVQFLLSLKIINDFHVLVCRQVGSSLAKSHCLGMNYYVNFLGGIASNGFYHGLWTPNEGINQRNLKFWADVADKICFGRT